jgi:hypothetical protein
MPSKPLSDYVSYTGWFRDMYYPDGRAGREIVLEIIRPELDRMGIPR